MRRVAAMAKPPNGVVPANLPPPGEPCAPPPDSGGPAPGSEEVLVVFVDGTTCPWLRVLRPGFRHCFAALRQGGRWLLVDPLKRSLEVRLLPPEAAGFDLAAFYLGQGHRVLRGAVPRRDPPPATGRGAALGLPRPLTCVETVKRLLGLDDGWVLTPWQLFRRLRRGPFVELR